MEVQESANSFKERIAGEVIRDVARLYFKDPKTKINDDISQLFSEYVSMLALEAALRAGKVAAKQGDTTIDVNSVEKILPQLMIDFN